MLLVFLGGMLGTAARLAVAMLIPDAASFPAATLIVNVVGAMLIGVLAARFRGGRGGRGADLRVFFGAGVLGGFTTYSAFAVGSIHLWSDAALLAAAYALATLVLGVSAAAVGMRLGRRRPR